MGSCGGMDATACERVEYVACACAIRCVVVVSVEMAASGERVVVMEAMACDRVAGMEAVVWDRAVVRRRRRASVWSTLRVRVPSAAWSWSV